MKLNDRVTIVGDLSHWTKTGQQNLPGVNGTIVEITSTHSDYGTAYLVQFDHPVQVNPVTTFNQAWFPRENLTGYH